MEPDKKTGFDRLFRPASVALVGASDDPMKWGAIILANMLSGNFDGRIYPVNPKRDEVQGLKAYPDILGLPETPDLVMIAAPARVSFEVMRQCAERGVKAVILISGGFSEEGEKGAELEREIAAIAREGGIQLVGPNTMGIFSGSKMLRALMPPVRPEAGSVAVISQSGNLGTQMLGMGQRMGVGFSNFVSAGNEAVLFTEDYLEYFGDDPKTKVILSYIEGLDHGRKFLEIGKRVSLKKPIVVFKGGRTKAGARAALSHSGALGGSEAVYDAAFRQMGAIQAATPDEMLDIAKALSRLPLPAGDRVGILSWGGGWGVVAADACEKAGLDVPDLPESAIREIDRVLPPYWSRTNPIDLVGILDREAHLKCFEAIVACDNVDAVVALGVVHTASLLSAVTQSVMGESNESQEFVKRFEESDLRFENAAIELIRKHGKPIICVTMAQPPQSHVETEESPVVYPTPHRAVNVLARMTEYAKFLKAANGQ